MSLNTPLVSVIVPVYNVRRYLCECLDSVIAQTYSHLEILVIDDGSTDGSGELCDQYQKKDPRIRVFHRENGGLSAARNTGLDNIQGDIVAFLDSDDCFLPDMIEKMISEMERTGADIVVCGFYSCYTTGKLTKARDMTIRDIKPGSLSSEAALRLLLEGELNINVWNKLYKRHILDVIRFPEGHVFEDKLIMPSVLERAEKIALISEPLICYRRRAGSITKTYSEKNAFDWLYADRLECDYISELPASVISGEQKTALFERRLKRMLLRYFMFGYNGFRRRAVPERVRTAYEKEILRMIRTYERHSAYTRFLCVLFEISPRLCYTVYHSIDLADRECKKIIRVLRSALVKK